MKMVSCVELVATPSCHHRFTSPVAGADALTAVLPPVVTGAVVMLIGFNLAPVVADTYWPQDQWVALIVDDRRSSR